VGPHWESFRSTADKLKAGRVGLSWSWAAFLFGPLWLAYRQRFAWAVLLLLFYDVAGIAFSGDGGDIASLIAAITPGIFGRALYLRQGLAKVDQIAANVPDERERLRQIDFAGGTNSNAVIVFILLAIAASAAMLWYGMALLQSIR
jgi:hypothetical protein